MEIPQKRRLVGAPSPQVRAEESDGSIPRDPRLLRVEGSEEVLFVQESVAGRIVVDLRLCAGGRLDLFVELMVRDDKIACDGGASAPAVEPENLESSLSHLDLAHLSRYGHGEFIAKVEVAGDLVVSQLSGAERSQLIDSQ
jgi:hypothetical protein